ncbi:MAG TPA: YjgP/YjgQ family permease [bacterium (Candidatus Stahlbacteria)]|nr:YjgP/YjgQ family permease [Candidatus Stahlbacteria bacterium]
MKTTDLQILRDYIYPFTFSLFALTFILFLQQLFRLIDLLVSKGVSISLVGGVFINSLPFIISSTVPMAILTATLMTFGRMAHDNELTVIFASGVRMIRLIRPLIIFNLITAILLILFNNLIVPNANYQVRKLMIEIIRKRPGVKLRSGVFTDEFPGYTIYIGSIDNRTSEVRDLTIYERKSRTIITAPAGRALTTDGGNTYIFELTNGEMHEPLSDGGYRRMKFKNQRLVIKTQTGSGRRKSKHRGDREMTIGMLGDAMHKEKKKNEGLLKHLKDLTLRAVDRYQNSGPRGVDLLLGQISSQIRKMKFSQRRISRYQVEIEKKIAIPFAVVIFLFLGAPLGYLVRRGGILGGILAIVFFSLYYILLITGEELADRALLPPTLAIWLPNIVIGLIALHFYLKVDRGRGLIG